MQTRTHNRTAMSGGLTLTFNRGRMATISIQQSADSSQQSVLSQLCRLDEVTISISTSIHFATSGITLYDPPKYLIGTRCYLFLSIPAPSIILCILCECVVEYPELFSYHIECIVWQTNNWWLIQSAHVCARPFKTTQTWLTSIAFHFHHDSIRFHKWLDSCPIPIVVQTNNIRATNENSIPMTLFLLLIQRWILNKYSASNPTDGHSCSKFVRRFVCLLLLRPIHLTQLYIHKISN